MFKQKCEELLACRSELPGISLKIIYFFKVFWQIIPALISGSLRGLVKIKSTETDVLSVKWKIQPANPQIWQNQYNGEQNLDFFVFRARNIWSLIFIVLSFVFICCWYRFDFWVILKCFFDYIKCKVWISKVFF